MTETVYIDGRKFSVVNESASPRIAPPVPSKKRSKYGAVKTVVDGIKFDSKREAVRWQELKLLERAGTIRLLLRQHAYQLAPSVRITGEKRARPALRFTADFRYEDCATGAVIVEDTKGFADAAFRIRQHLMKSVHGIDVRLVR